MLPSLQDCTKTNKKILTAIWAVFTVQPISTEYTARATAMTERVIPPHIPQYWNDTTAHPWRRYFARSLDMILCNYITMGMAFAIIFTVTKVAMVFFDFDPDSLIRQFDSLVNLYPIQVKIMDGLLVIIVSTIITAILIGLVGSSAGKWLFGVRVLNNEYKPIGFKLAFKRELMVLYRGIAFSIPVILCIAEFIAYGELRKNGITTWDRDLDCTVLHKYMGLLQIFLCIIGFIIVFGVFMLIGISRLVG